MKILVIMPGGFHPFHAGHFSLYDKATKEFPGADVYVAATNDTSTRPFPFAIKQKLARLAGVPENRFVQVRSPFRAEEITQKYDPKDTVLIFVRSEKDRSSPPRPGGTKKDGSPSYLQPLGKNLKPMNQHAYMEYLPTVKFGPGLEHASQIRAVWPDLNARRKTALIMSLYPVTQTNPGLAQTVVKMLDAAIGKELTEQPNQAGVATNTQTNQAGAVANAQPQTNTTSTAPKTSAGTIPATSAAPGQPATSTSTTSTPTTTSTTSTPTTTSTTSTPTSNSVPPDKNVTDLAKRLGVDPKRLQSELQGMQEDYLDEKRH